VLAVSPRISQSLETDVNLSNPLDHIEGDIKTYNEEYQLTKLAARSSIPKSENLSPEAAQQA